MCKTPLKIWLLFFFCSLLRTRACTIFIGSLLLVRFMREINSSWMLEMWKNNVNALMQFCNHSKKWQASKLTQQRINVVTSSQRARANFSIDVFCFSKLKWCYAWVKRKYYREEDKFVINVNIRALDHNIWPSHLPFELIFKFLFLFRLMNTRIKCPSNHFIQHIRFPLNSFMRRMTNFPLAISQELDVENVSNKRKIKTKC